MRMAVWLLFTSTATALMGCHNHAERVNKPPEARHDLFGNPLPPLLDPVTTPPLIINPTATAPADASWQLLDTAGGELVLASATMNFSPRSAQWRFTLTSEKTPQATARPNQDHSYLKVSLWIGEKDAKGNVALRPVKVDFKRKGGAQCLQEFDNGLWPDGSPRPFQITINGTYVTYLARVEDLGPTATAPPKAGPVSDKDH